MMTTPSTSMLQWIFMRNGAELARYLRDTGWHLSRRGVGRQLRAA
jgi:hypothetical protein